MNDMSGRWSAANIGGAIGIEPALNLDIAHIWRSKLVEKCAEAERHILRLSEAAGATCQVKAPLSQKIEALKRALGGNARIARPAKLLSLLEALRPLSDLRSDVVHSTISIAAMEGESVAVFRSTAEQQEGAGVRTIMTLACLKGAHEKLSQIANGLKQEADQA